LGLNPWRIGTYHWADFLKKILGLEGGSLGKTKGQFCRVITPNFKPTLFAFSLKFPNKSDLWKLVQFGPGH